MTALDKCDKCNNGKFLSVDMMSCIDACPEGQYSYTDKTGIVKCHTCPEGCPTCSYDTDLELV
jgi:ferredoxin